MKLDTIRDFNLRKVKGEGLSELYTLQRGVNRIKRTLPRFESLRQANKDNLFDRTYDQPRYMWRTSKLGKLLGYEEQEFNGFIKRLFAFCVKNDIHLRENIISVRVPEDTSYLDFLLTRYGCFILMVYIDHSEKTEHRVTKHLEKIVQLISLAIEKKLFTGSELEVTFKDRDSNFWIRTTLNQF